MNVEERDLSASEARIMRVIWDAGGVIPLLEIMQRLKRDYGKDYSRNSVATFLLRMTDKGFVESYKKGRNAYIVALKNRDEYAYQQLSRDKEEWFARKTSNLMSALIKKNDITKEDIAEIRRMLDELDDTDEGPVSNVTIIEDEGTQLTRGVQNLNWSVPSNSMRMTSGFAVKAGQVISI